MKKKILYIHSGDNWIAGSERMLLRLTEKFDSNKFEPYLICDQPELERVAKEKNIPVVRFPYFYFLLDYQYKDLNPFPYWRTLKEVNHWVKEWGIDFIHVTNINSCQIAVPVAKWNRIPITVHIQGTYLKRSRLFSLAWACDRVISVSEGIAKPYKKSKLYRKKLQVIYNGLDFIEKDSAIRNKIRSEFHFSDEDVVVGCVAFLIIRKRVDHFIQVAHQFKGNPKAKFLIVGTGPEEEALKKLVKELKMESQIIFTGHREDVSNLLQAMDLFCLIPQADPMPYSVMEATMAGLPVVAANVDGLAEAFEDQKGGFLVSPGDLKSVESGIATLIENKELREQMGEEARQRAQKKFSYSVVIPQIEEVYEELIRGKNGLQ